MAATKDQPRYSLSKSRQIMHTSYSWYKKKGKTLPPLELESFEADLENLDQALLRKDRETADVLAKRLELFCSTHFKKSFLTYVWELAVALVLALIIATIVRQMWFEPYEIPTGSMRPTFKEQDHLTVSKLTFGINMPLETKHLYFDPSLVQRTSVFIFSGDKMPIIDQETTYFGIIPYKKRYIKRNMGKPGDTLYFYGGKIYGIDKDENPIKEFIESPWLKGLEHVPFLNFEGPVTMPKKQNFIFNQMHLPIGRLSRSTTGMLIGEVFDGTEWVKDQVDAQNSDHNSIKTYSDFWGMRNYAMARLLTKEQLQMDKTLDIKDLPEGVLYLELRHTPSLNNAKIRSPLDSRSSEALITPFKTVIPLQQEHLDAILDNMYTARFVIENGRATRYNVEGSRFSNTSPRFPGVPDGTYEFYYGKADKVGWGGITSKVPSDSPLYKRDPVNIQKLFNAGIEMDMLFSPQNNDQRYFPQRYAYFRDGDLYLLGAPIMKKNDPVLEAFNAQEQLREEASSKEKPYVAFRDYGAPLKADGTYNIDFLHTFGLKIPEGHYLALGDNHAMSSDSRIFGFIPADNIQGAPSLIIWPTGSRWGFPEQKPYPIFTFPRMLVWGIALLIAAISYAIHRRNLKKPIFKKIERQ